MSRLTTRALALAAALLATACADTQPITVGSGSPTPTSTETAMPTQPSEQEAGPPGPASWHGVTAKAAALALRLAGAPAVTWRAGAYTGHGWQADGALVVQAGGQAAYVCAPLDAGLTCADGGLDRLLAVTERAIVLGPLDGVTAPQAAAVAEALDAAQWRELSNRPVPAIEGVQVIACTAHRGWIHLEVAEPGTDFADIDARVGAAFTGERVLLTLVPDQGPRRSRFVPYVPYVAPERPYDPEVQQLAPSVSLSGALAQMHERVLGVFDAALDDALLDADPAMPERRVRAWNAAAYPLYDAIISYPGHSGPAFAAGDAAFGRHLRELAALLSIADPGEPDGAGEFHSRWMSSMAARAAEPEAPVDLTAPEEFPGYDPKTSPDTAVDYRPSLVRRFAELPAATLENLPALLDHLGEWQRVALSDPGAVRAGNLILGAPHEEYVPSDAELIAAECGDRVAAVVRTTGSAARVKVLDAAGIGEEEAPYSRFSFTHADVMGSGRFFYASMPEPVTVKLRE